VATGVATLTITSATAATATASLSPTYETLTGTTAVPAGTLIRIAGMPFDYTLLDPATLQLGGPSAIYSWPRTANGYNGSVSASFSLQVAPMITGGGQTILGGNACIDLPSSTIGVYDYSTSPSVLSNASPLILTFDSVGRLKTVTCTLSGSNAPRQLTAEPRTPIALLVGLRDQITTPYASPPTEDNPGRNWQRNDAWWVVLDPRTSSVFQVENAPNSTTLNASQKFIRQKLKNNRTAN
jgi:hypothetical protein